MKYIKKDSIEIDALPGRGLLRAVGKDGVSLSEALTVGYAEYSDEYGPMEAHHHAEEVVVITKCKDGRVRWGDDKNDLVNSMDLEVGMILHFPPLEWHVFEYDKDGFIEIVYIYGGTDNIRPEDK